MTKKKEQPESIIAFKGFDKNLVCNPDGKPFQYEIGKTYEHEGKVVRCAAGGFHACLEPLNVFQYYAPGTSRYAQVIMSGEVSTDGAGDSKIAGGKITIEMELTLPQFIGKAVDWIMARIKNTKSAGEERSLATNTGYQSAATNTGDQSAATNTGYQSAATNTGYQSAATSTGYQSAASVEGVYSVAISSGYEGRAKACAGSAIVLCYRDEYRKLIHIRSAMVGQDGIKADVWYSLDASGEFIETEA